MRRSYSEVEYKKKVESLYNGEIEVVSRYISLAKPILVKDKYGVLKIPTASYLLEYRPDIKAALNKTEYFMNQLMELYPEIAKQLKPMSEYKTMKKKMLFDTKFGLVSCFPDALIHGYCPNVRSAVNRKEYMRNQLLYLYDNKYDFDITSTDRHEGRIILICPIHGRVSVDSCHIFSGSGCPECNKTQKKSDLLYIVKLTSSDESFYKLGITMYNNNHTPRRFREYKQLGFDVDIILLKHYETYLECRDKEHALKQIIKNNLYQPKKWPYESSTECFTKDLLELVIEQI